MSKNTTAGYDAWKKKQDTGAPDGKTDSYRKWKEEWSRRKIEAFIDSKTAIRDREREQEEENKRNRIAAISHTRKLPESTPEQLIERPSQQQTPKPTQQQISQRGWEAYLKDQETARQAEQNKPWWQTMAESAQKASYADLPGVNILQMADQFRADESWKQPSDRWSEEQRQYFGTLYSQNPEEAMEYAADLNGMLDYMEKQEKQKALAAEATRNVGSGLIGTVKSIAAGTLGIGEYATDLAENLGRGRITERGTMLSPMEYSSAISQGISQKLNERGTLDEDIPVIGGKGWGDVYQLGSSIAQSMASAHTLGPVGTMVSYFGQAAASAVDDARARGADDEQALLYGMLSGSAEAAAEKIGLDNLLKIKAPGTMRDLLWNVAKQGISEAGEEGVTYILDAFADNLVLQDKSQMNVRKAEYIASGMTEEEANRQVWKDTVNDAAFSVLGGGVSGGISGGAESGIKLALGKNKSAPAAHVPTEETVEDGEPVIPEEEIPVPTVAEEPPVVPTVPEVPAAKTIPEPDPVPKAPVAAADQTAPTTPSSVKPVAVKPTAIEKPAAKPAEPTAMEMADRLLADLFGEPEPDVPEAVTPEQAAETVAASLSDLGLQDSELQLLVENFQDSEMDPDSYVAGVRTAFRYGELGVPRQELLRPGNFTDELTEHQRKAAYEMGLVYGREKTAAAATALQGKKAPAGAGKVVFNGDRTKLNQTQATGLAALDRVASALGVEFRIFESYENEARDLVYKDESGKEVSAPNGFYQGGVIHLDLNAGSNGEGTILFTAAHELTHFMKEWSPDKFRTLSETVLDEFAGRGESVDQLVDEQINKAAKQNRKLDYEAALEEVVADAMESMLADGTIAQKLGKLDRGTRGKIRDWFRDFAAKIRKAYEGLKPDSAEGRMVAEMADAAERLHKLFEEGLTDAGRNFKRAEKNTAEVGGEVRYSMRDVDIQRVYIDYNDEKSVISAIQHTADSLMHRGKAVVITDKQIQKEMGMADWSNRDDARRHIKRILEDFIGETVYFEHNGQFAEAYLTRDGINHAAGSMNNPKKAGSFRKFRELIQNAEYSYSSKNDPHSNRNKKISGRIDWDCFVAAVDYDGDVYPIAFKVRTIDRDSRSQIYAITTKNKTDVPHGDGRQNNQSGVLPNYEDSPVSDKKVAQPEAKVNAKFSGKDSVVTEGAKPLSADEIVTDGAVVTDGTGIRYSLRSMKSDIAEGQMFEDLQTYCGWNPKQVSDLKRNLQDLVAYMTPYRDILDMNERYGREGRRFSPYKPNSDPLYKISMDFSTLCSKRLLTQYVIENLQLRENRPMSAEEQMAIRDMLNEYRKTEQGLQVACAMCYVEAARLKSPQQISRWLADPESYLKDYFAKKNPEFKARVDKAQEDFKESRGYARNAVKKNMKPADVRKLNEIGPKMRSEYQPSAEEQAIIRRAKALPNSTYLTAGNLANLSETEPEIYKAYTERVRNATRSKSLETDEPYYYGDSRRDNGNGIVVTDTFIENVNRENGMRFSSWSDWRIQHMLDYITAVIDNSVRGAAMHGYTKFPEEVRVLGKTGMMFNMSGVAGTQNGLNADGSLSFSPTESIDAEEAVRLREEFPDTAGLQCIGVSDEHISALLDSDIIDYVIPYHTSGLNAGLRRMANIHGWKDYTSTQHAAADKSVRKEDAQDPEHWHEEPVYSEFFVGYDTGMSGIEAMKASAERYKQMCRDRGLKPKFEKFAREDGYWKLLIDRKMVNQVTGELIRQKPVSPEFDFDEIRRVVDRYVENYDSGLESRALNHIVENWDSIPDRIRELKKQKNAKNTKAKKAMDTLASQTLAAQPAVEGAKFSLRDPEYQKVRKALEQENEKLREDVKDLKALVKLQRQVTGGTKFTQSSVEAAAGMLMKKAGARGNKAELAPILNRLYEYIAKGDELTWEGVAERAREAVGWLMEHTAQATDADLSESEYRYNRELIAQDLTREVYDSYWSVSTLKTAADVKQKEIDRLKGKHYQQMDKLRASHKEKVQTMKKEHSDRLKQIRADHREAMTKQAREASQRFQESRKSATESRHRTEMRHKIQRVVKKLNDLLLNETKDRHVPEAMKRAVADALDVVNMDTVGAEARIAELDRQIATAKTEEKKQELMRTRLRVAQMGGRMKERLDALKTAYDAIRTEGSDALVANAFDEVISSKIQEVVELVGETALRDMTMEQLEAVYDLYTMVAKSISSANKAFKLQRSESINQLGNTVMQEISSSGGDKKDGIRALESLKGFAWNNLKPSYVFKAIGSKTLSELFDNVRSGEDVWAGDVRDAREFYLKQAEKYGATKWDADKRFLFTSNTGKEFELNLQQMMSLYAYSKRPQADDHLARGGFVFDSETTFRGKAKGVPVEKVVTEATAYNLNREQLGQIVSALTPEQRAFVDAMQTYLSETMGAKGNEVSMALYDVRLFKEKNYFPLKSARQFLFEQTENTGEVRLKNSGFSKKTVAHANNPVILSGFMDVWANHVNDMSMYHAFVLPLEDFNRVFNYKSSNTEDSDSSSVKMVLQNAFGVHAERYIKQLLTDLNGGARVDPTTGFINKMMGKFKKGAVFASLSVVVQQPSAIARAMAMVEGNYFIGPKVDKKRHKALWEEVKRYAPVALIKEMGYFDTSMGQSTVDYITAEEYSSLGEKAKALFADSGYRDEVLSRLPALADEISWCYIWEGVKRETAAKHPKMDRGSDEFLRLAGRRFTDVIVSTQVYDSVLSRSANMRSRDTGMKMATAFLAEPTTSINMVADALVQGKRGDRKYARRAIGSVIASQILNATLVSFVYAMRDDDEDKTYGEKYLSNFVGNVLDGMNPLTYLPFIKDIVSIVQGYEVERSDMAVISDLWNAWQKLGSDSLSPWRKVENFAGSIAQIFGLPLKNIMRDVRGIYQTVENISTHMKTTRSGIGYAVRENLPGWMGGGTFSNQEQLYQAILDGDEVYVQRVKARYADEDSVYSAVRRAVKQGLTEEDITDEQATQILVEHGGMSEDEAESRVQYVEFQNQYPSFEMSEAKVSKYYEMLEPSGISAEQYWSYLQSLPEDPKKEDILEVIHSMKLTREQKDALYLAEGYAESKLKDAPWN